MPFRDQIANEHYRLIASIRRIHPELREKQTTLGLYKGTLGLVLTNEYYKPKLKRITFYSYDDKREIPKSRFQKRNTNFYNVSQY